MQPHKIPFYFFWLTYVTNFTAEDFHDTIFTSLQDQTDKLLIFFSHGLESIK